jgi:hypothetical protein
VVGVDPLPFQVDGRTAAQKVTPRALVPVSRFAEPLRLVVIEEHPVTRIGLVSVVNAERDMMSSMLRAIWRPRS